MYVVNRWYRSVLPRQATIDFTLSPYLQYCICLLSHDGAYKLTSTGRVLTLPCEIFGKSNSTTWMLWQYTD